MSLFGQCANTATHSWLRWATASEITALHGMGELPAHLNEAEMPVYSCPLHRPDRCPVHAQFPGPPGTGGLPPDDGHSECGDCIALGHLTTTTHDAGCGLTGDPGECSVCTQAQANRPGR